MKYLSLIFAAFLLVACGDRVEVPPAHVGKILTKNGYAPDTIPPSKFRLDWCWAYCDKLVVAQVADVGVKEQFQLFMPKDQLNMSFDLRGTFAIKSDTNSVNQIFDRVLAQPVNSSWYDSVITFEQVYQVYGQQVLRDVVRSAIAKFSINDVASNREAVNAEITSAVHKGLAHTPLEAIRLGLADVQFPDVIVEAKEAAKKREVEIQKAEADFEVRKVELQKELEEQRMLRNIEKEKAARVAEANEIVSKSVTPDYIAYRQLEVLESMAQNGNSFIVPMEALGTIGLQQRIFSKDVKEK